MRATTAISTAVIGLATVLASVQSAGAFDLRHGSPDGSDPYAYEYVPKGYYPYYNSSYWKPATEFQRQRPNFELPEYHRAWGSTKESYDHRIWHQEHHGGHRKWDW